MESPFPGMDPYLEAHWRDVHHRLVLYAADALQEQLPPDLRARVEERVFVSLPEGPGRRVYPDVRVIARRGANRVREPGGGGAAVAEPLVIHGLDELASEGYVEIIDVRSGNRVVTVLEVLSAANKQPGEGMDQYLRKQRELRAGQVSLVEIDLLRAGDWVLSVPRSAVPVDQQGPFRLCVCRGWEVQRWEYYHAPLRERLPVIRVPLRETDDDVTLDVQALIDQCYRNGRYDDIDYTREPDPPLAPADTEWLNGLLHETGHR